MRIIKYLLLFTCFMGLYACSQGNSNSSSANVLPQPAPNPNQIIGYTLPNGTVVSSPVKALTITQNATTTTNISIYGGKPGLEILLGSANESGINVTFSPNTLVSGSTTTSSTITITTSNLPAGNYKLPLTVTFPLSALANHSKKFNIHSQNDSNSTITIGNLEINVSQQNPIIESAGFLTLSPQSVHIPYNTESQLITLSLIGSQNISNVVVSLSNSNESGLQLNTSTCTLSTNNNSCPISLTSLQGNSESAIITAMANGYNDATTTVFVDNFPTPTHGNLNISSPNVIFNNGALTESVTLNLSGESGYLSPDTPLTVSIISESSGIVTTSPESCIFTANGSCNINLIANNSGTTQINFGASESTYNTPPLQLVVSIPLPSLTLHLDTRSVSGLNQSATGSVTLNGIGINDGTTIIISSNESVTISPTSCILNANTSCAITVDSKSYGKPQITASTSINNIQLESHLLFGIYKTPLVFLTRQSYNGNLGGESGADQKCQAQANSVNPPLPGTYKALITTINRSPCNSSGQCDSSSAINWPLRAAESFYTPTGRYFGQTNSSLVFDGLIYYQRFEFPDGYYAGGSAYDFWSGIQSVRVNKTTITPDIDAWSAFNETESSATNFQQYMANCDNFRSTKNSTNQYFFGSTGFTGENPEISLEIMNGDWGNYYRFWDSSSIIKAKNEWSKAYIEFCGALLQLVCVATQ